MRLLHKIAFLLLVIGGLNWLLHAFNYEVVHYLGTPIAMIVYVLVGLSAIFELFTHKMNCKDCGMSDGKMAGGKMYPIRLYSL